MSFFLRQDPSSLAIYKYALEFGKYVPELNDFSNECLIQMPSDARVLSVQLQNGEPTLWALVDPELRGGMETRKFVLMMTGEKFEGFMANLVYHATLQHPEGLVLHIFERILKSVPV